MLTPKKRFPHFIWVTYLANRCINYWTESKCKTPVYMLMASGIYTSASCSARCCSFKSDFKSSKITDGRLIDILIQICKLLYQLLTCRNKTWIGDLKKGFIKNWYQILYAFDDDFMSDFNFQKKSTFNFW